MLLSLQGNEGMCSLNHDVMHAAMEAVKEGWECRPTNTNTAIGNAEERVSIMIIIISLESAVVGFSASW
jgi:hypothetical protein